VRDRRPGRAWSSGGGAVLGRGGESGGEHRVEEGGCAGRIVGGVGDRCSVFVAPDELAVTTPHVESATGGDEGHVRGACLVPGFGPGFAEFDEERFYRTVGAKPVPRETPDSSRFRKFRPISPRIVQTWMTQGFSCWLA